ncbi:MAG: protein-disulfide reductase DsbD domain-containing protein [Pseudomonadota bacterium]
MIRLLLVALSVLIGLIAPVHGAPAQEAGAVATAETEYVSSTLIPEHRGFAPGQTLWFALQQNVEEKWHVFWKNPGDAGLPLETRWSAPDGFEVGETLFPVPEHIPVGPFANFAHEDEVTFLIPVTAPESLTPGDTVTLDIAASWQVCEEICVPEDAAFSFSLPVLEDPAVNPQTEELFEIARAALPKPLEASATFSAIAGGFQLRINDWSGPAATNPYFYPVLDGIIEPAAPQALTLEGGVLSLDFQPGWVGEVDGNRVDGVLGLDATNPAAGGFSLTALGDGVIGKPRPAMATPQIPQSASLGMMLALAFFGGLILNAMPCVFPIVFIKAASLLHSAQADRATTRRHGLAFALGVVATFALIGGLMLGLRAGGEALGWGFHLQSPIVVILSAYVLFLVGLNLAGVFSIGESIAGAGDGLTRRGGLGGAFFTGALTVVVAAPCVGPLLSAPIGATLVLPAPAAMMVFVVMALGLAAPYLAFSFAPGLGKILPRPGPWMNVFKQTLSFPVFAAAAYFAWVAAQQTGGAGLAIVLSGAVLLSFAAWAFERSRSAATSALVTRALAGLAIVAAIAPLFQIDPVSTAESETYDSIETVSYDETTLAQTRAAGRAVFVDFTAAWCVTCQFNKATILKSQSVVAAFTQTNTLLMVADWTVRDPNITAALEAHGANGVPLYVYYGADGAAQILPLPLTRAAILTALQQGRI